jgi:phage-related protein
MSDVDLIISVHTTGVKDVANLSASVRNLALNLKGVTVPMRALDSHAKAVNKALGITSKGVNQHANSLKELKANQAALSEESKRLRSNIQNYNLAILKAGGPTTKLGKELTFTQNQLKAFSTTLRGLRIRSFGSDLSNISLKLQKMGKDAQFVGRSLMINLTAPLLLFGRTGLQSLIKVDAALVRLTKVLEGVAMTAEQADQKLGKGLGGADRQAAINKMVNSFKALESGLTSLSNKFGVSKDLVIGLATDFAELGISANENIVALTELTLVTEKLGNMDAAGAQDLSQALYFNSVRALEASGAFDKLTDAREREARAIGAAKTQLNMFNNIENVTALTLKDLSESLPELGSMAVSFGLSMTEAAALLAPMKAAGLDVGASANSIKVSLQRAISPTKQNTELLASLAKQYGVASDTQNIFNQTTKTGLTGLQAIVDVFDKVQSTSAGAEGALKLMSEIFEKRQGPRMYIAIQQMAQFNKELNRATRSAGTSEGILASTAEGALSKFNQLNGTALPVTINNFKDIGIIARIATAQSGQMVEGFRKVSAAEIKTAKEVRKAVADVVVQKKQNEGIDIIGTAKTESARAMLVELAGASNAQQVADMELEQSLGSLEVAVQKIKNSFKLFAADLMKTIGPALKSMADKIQAFYEKWQSLSEATRQNISKVILGFLAFLAVLGPIVLGIGTIQASMGVLGRALTGLFPKLTSASGGFVGLGESAALANGKIKALYGTIVAKSLQSKLLGTKTGSLADAQSAAQAAMGSFAAPKSTTFTPKIAKPLAPLNQARITQAEQMREFLRLNPGSTQSDFIKSRSISKAMTAGRPLTPAQDAYRIANRSKVSSIPGAIHAGKISAVARIDDINKNIRTGVANRNATGIRAAFRQNQVAARDPFYKAKGIATDRMGTRFFRAGEELLDDTTPGTPSRTRGALSRLSGGRISATRRLLGTAEDQANILAGGGVQGARMQTQLRARKAVGGIKDFATTSKTANLGKGFVEALRPIKQFKAGVSGAKGAMAALEAQQRTLGLAAPSSFAKAAAGVKGFVTNIKLANVAMKILRLTMLATGIGAIILGIGVAVMLVVKNFGAFKEKAAGPLRGLAYAFGVIKKALMEITRPIQDLFAQFGGGAKGTEGSVNGLVTIFRQFVKVVQMVAQAFKSLVENIIKPYLYAVVNIVMAVVSMFRGNWGDALKFLTAAFARVAEVLVSIWQAVMKVLVKVAGFIVKAIISLFAGLMKILVKIVALGVKLILTALTAVPKAVAAGFGWLGKIPGMGWFKSIGDGINGTIDGMYGLVDAGADAASGAIDAVADGAKGLVDGATGLYGAAIDGIGNAIKGGLKKGTDLGVKESTHSLQNGKKKIVDTGEEIGEETGEAIANATGDGFEENDPSGKIGEKLKDGIKSAVQDLQNYIAGELSSAIGKYVDASIKSLEKQRDSALKIFDVQIKTLGKLEKAEESLTKTKEFEANKRKMLDDKALSDEQFRRNYALAVYEGRTDDARMLQLEQVSQTKSFNQDLNSLESGRAKDLAKENLDALKDAINEAKDAAQKFFDESIVKFQESIETITKFPPVTIEDYKTQIGELYNITNQTATDNSAAFEKMFTNFATTINTKMPNDVVGAFSTNLDELVLVAKEKYGLGSDTSENTVIGVTIGMLASIGGVFGDKKQTVIDSFGLVTTGLKDNFAESATAIVKSVTDDFLTPFAEATTKFKDNWEKVYKQAIIDGNKAITDALRNDVSVNKELFEEMRGYIDATTLKWLGLKAAAEAAGEAQKDAAAGGGGGGGSTGSTPSGAGLNVGRADAFTSNNALRTAKGLAPLTYQQFTVGTGLSTAAIAAKPIKPAFIPNPSLKPTSRAKGGIIPTRTQNQNSGYPEGYIPAPTQEGVPALLHGGEYILNAKAVSRIGIGALNKMNNNLLPKFAKGGVIPGGKRGSASNTRGSADRLEASNLARISKAQNQRNADLKNVGIAKNFVGPIAPVVKSESKSILGKIGSFAREMAKPSNSFAMIGAAIGTALGGLGGFGFGAVPGGIGGAAIGGAIGTFTEQSFDKVKGFQPLAIAKNAVMQGVFQAAGIGVAKYVAPLLKPSSLKLMLQSKFPGVGSYLSGTVGRLFGKSATSEVADVALRTIPLPKFQSALPAGSKPFGALPAGGAPSLASRLQELVRVNGAIPLGRSTVPMPTASVENILMHGGPSELLGGMINPEFIRGGYGFAALKGLHPLGVSEASLITQGTERSQTTAILTTYKQMLDVLRNTGKYEFSQLAPNMVKPGEIASTGAAGEKFIPWGEQIETATKWINQHKSILALKLKGVPHSTGVPPFQGFGSGAYDYGADRSAHLIEVPDNLLPKSFWSSFGDSGAGRHGEIPFFGSFKPFAAVTSEDAARFSTGTNFNHGTYLAAGVEIANHLNNTLPKETLAAFQQSMMAGNQITPGARGVILKQLETISWNALDYNSVKQQMAAAMNVDEMLNIMNNATANPERNAASFKTSKDYLLSLIKTVGDPSITPLVKPVVTRSDDEIIADIMKSSQFTGLESWQKERFLQIIKDTISGKSLNAKLLSDSIGSSLFRQPNPYDVLGALRSNLPITDLISQVFDADSIPKFKKGGYVPGSPSTPIPAMLHGGEYVINADAVRNMGVRTMQSINQSKFRAPSGTPSYASGGGSTSVSTVNINVDTFVGEEEWFKSMMKSYNINVLPKQQKAAGVETRTFTSYNGINQGL